MFPGNRCNRCNSFNPFNFCALLPLVVLLLCSFRASALTTNLLAAADTTLMEPFPTNNLGGMNVVLVGTSENLKRHRALLRFDVAAQLPVGSKIKTASITLELAWLPSNGYAQAGMGLHRLLRAWGEGDKQS